MPLQGTTETVPGRCFAVLPAAGIGARMGVEIPKQYLEIQGRSLLEYSVEALLACDAVSALALVLHPQDAHASTLPLLRDTRVLSAVGGAERSDSVLAGLNALSTVAEEDDWVLVHDAARPCLRAKDVQRLVDVVIGNGEGGILAQRVVDTVKQATPDGLVQATLDRSRLWRAQTPQMFRLGELRGALELARRDDAPVTDEASAMELAGHPVQLVEGPASNLKVTLPEDLALAAWYLAQQEEQD
jgi:2-C-methyl-D-erythritol 4-phosphate cytidylyltransferase